MGTMYQHTVMKRFNRCGNSGHWSQDHAQWLGIQLSWSREAPTLIFRGCAGHECVKTNEVSQWEQIDMFTWVVWVVDQESEINEAKCRLIQRHSPK